MADRIKFFREKLKDQPDNLLFQFSLAQELYNTERYDEALAPLQACVTGREDWMVPRILLGKTYQALNQIDSARNHLEKALQLAREQNHEDPEMEISALLADLEA